MFCLDVGYENQNDEQITNDTNTTTTDTHDNNNNE